MLLALPPADHLLNERDRGQFVPSRRRRVMANVRAERLLKTPAEPGPELRIPALGDGSFTSIPSCARSLASAPPRYPAPAMEDGASKPSALSHFTGYSCACANLLLGARKWTPF